MFKLAILIASVLLSLTVAVGVPAQPPGPDGPPKAKGKGHGKKEGKPGPRGDLRKAYDLLRRLRADETSAGRPEQRIRDWTERATNYYRDGLKALDAGDGFRAHEHGAIAHDLARAADHAQHAALFDRRDPELPPPDDEFGDDESSAQVRRELQRAYDRISEMGDGRSTPDADYYLKACRDLYSAARRDVAAGRTERGGELARAADAMTHVVEHLGHVAAGPPEARGAVGSRPGGRGEPAPPPDRPEPKTRPVDRPDADLPPSLLPR